MPSSPLNAADHQAISKEEQVPQHTTTVHDHAPFEPWAIARIAVAILGACALWFHGYEPRFSASFIGLVTLVFAGWPMFLEAARNLFARRMTMELSMTIAIVAAAAISEFFTAVVVMLFVLVAEELEHLTVARGRLAIKSLIDFVPREAHVRRDGEVKLVALDEIKAGDVVLVSPGEKVPVDGTVTGGRSYVDQSRITGESMPAEKIDGATVYAGSINQMGALEIRVERVGRDTSYGRIVEAVEHAEQTRAPVQKLADQLSGYLVYLAVGAAIITYALTRDVRDTISVVIVAGACGIAAGTPLAILGGIGRAARLGSIIKGGIHLETLGCIDTVVLDKTGTLTLGEPAVQAVEPAAGVASEEILRFTASAELQSEHPLARAIIVEASRRSIAVPEPTNFTYTIGRGITALIEGHTVLVGNRKLLTEAGIATPERRNSWIGSDITVGVDGRYLGEIIVADPIRSEAGDAIRDLHRLKVRTLLLTGDTAAVGQSVAAELGIDEVVSDMLPEDKLKKVRELVADGRIVAMVGDGVNDAPALTAAHIGIAMGSGTDIAKESADVVLIGNDLSKLVETLRIAQWTRAIIWQNFAGTIGVDALGITLAAFGYLNPLLAAFIHVSSEIAFILNSARLLPIGESSPARMLTKGIR